MLIRLQKFLAEHGIASRRKSEQLILDGKISVNDQIVKVLGIKINPETDIIKYKGKLVKKASQKTYIKLYKPVGYVCSHRSFIGEKNIFQILKKKKNLTCVGRLDKDSEGLLLLTDNGDLANQLMHPKFKHEKEYIVVTSNPIEKNHLLAMAKGIKIKNTIYQIKKFKLHKKKLCHITLTEGKKRHIRELFNHFNYKITTLKRIRIKELQLGTLKPGQYKPLTPKEIQNLKETKKSKPRRR